MIIPRKTRNAVITLQFVAPALLFIGVFVIFPIARTVVMSFQKWHLTSGDPHHSFLGLANFRDVVTSPSFPSMANVTLLYTFFSVMEKMWLGLAVALLLNKKFRGRSFVRGLMLIPWAMPGVVACTIFLIALDPSYGIINHYLVAFHLLKEPITFFSRKSTALFMVILIGIWKNFPFVSLMLLAALQGIAPDYYEAASIDGANAWEKFRHITWPSLSPIWNTLLTLEILWTVKEFELVFLLTRGGPDQGTAIIGVDIYLNAFRFYKVGSACAEGILLLAFCLVFTVIYFRQQAGKGGAS